MVLEMCFMMELPLGMIFAILKHFLVIGILQLSGFNGWSHCNIDMFRLPGYYIPVAPVIGVSILLKDSSFFIFGS